MDINSVRQSLAGRQIMVVEDSSFLGAIIREMLEEVHCSVLGPFRCVADAKAALDAASPHAAILDISLGGELTFELGEELGKRGVPVLMISGYHSHTVPTAFRRGFLQKPFDEAMLLSALANVLGGSPGSSPCIVTQEATSAAV